ncbi:MAG TPA: 50S ribosomal protein L31 [Candidatus Paceibacterota bacterium]
MKKDIHPTYYPKAKVTCACGNTFVIGGTKETLAVEICSNCHPFYTGQDKIMDKVGRVQKFKEKLALRQAQGKPKKDKSKKSSPGSETKQRGSARVTTKKK